jgi:hypothetical protein
VADGDDLRLCGIFIEMADCFFSSSWRILEPYGCARLEACIRNTRAPVQGVSSAVAASGDVNSKWPRSDGANWVVAVGLVGSPGGCYSICKAANTSPVRCLGPVAQSVSTPW